MHAPAHELDLSTVPHTGFIPSQGKTHDFDRSGRIGGRIVSLLVVSRERQTAFSQARKEEEQYKSANGGIANQSASSATEWNLRKPVFPTQCIALWDQDLTRK